MDRKLELEFLYWFCGIYFFWKLFFGEFVYKKNFLKLFINILVVYNGILFKNIECCYIYKLMKIDEI